MLPAGTGSIFFQREVLEAKEWAAAGLAVAAVILYVL